MLGGCFTISTEYAKDMVGEGYPDEYYDGFAAGCDSGLERGGHSFRSIHNDYRAYKSNRFYKSGWDDGEKKCYNDAIKRKREERENLRQIAVEKYLREGNK